MAFAGGEWPGQRKRRRDPRVHSRGTVMYVCVHRAWDITAPPCHRSAAAPRGGIGCTQRRAVKPGQYHGRLVCRESRLVRVRAPPPRGVRRVGRVPTRVRVCHTTHRPLTSNARQRAGRGRATHHVRVVWVAIGRSRHCLLVSTVHTDHRSCNSIFTKSKSIPTSRTAAQPLRPVALSVTVRLTQ